MNWNYRGQDAFKAINYVLVYSYTRRICANFKVQYIAKFLVEFDIYVNTVAIYKFNKQ